MLIIYVFLPESPPWCISRGQEERAKKNMRLIYGGVEGFDVDAQYEVMARAVEHEREVAIELKQTKWYNIFKGTNRVSRLPAAT